MLQASPSYERIPELGSLEVFGFIGNYGKMTSTGSISKNSAWGTRIPGMDSIPKGSRDH
jgi:hypothetical protein